MNTLIENVLQWGKDKGITGPNGKGTIEKQFRKFVEEMNELFEALEKNDTKEIRDALGDLQVVAIQANSILRGHLSQIKIPDYTGGSVESNSAAALFHLVSLPLSSMAFVRAISENLGHDPDECLQEAYDEIKGRTGVMTDGVFVKDSPSIDDDLGELDPSAACKLGDESCESCQ
jgi:hypothetical protein